MKLCRLYPYTIIVAILQNFYILLDIIILELQLDKIDLKNINSNLLILLMTFIKVYLISIRQVKMRKMSKINSLRVI